MFFKAARRLPACAIVCGAALFSVSTLADTDVFTALDNPATAKQPFVGNLQAGFNAQTGNTSSSNLNANTTMTWFNNDFANSIWGSAVNSSSSGVRSSEKYQAGARTRYNLSDVNYLFGQANWLTDRYNGYHARDTATVGYGRQLLNGPIHTLNLEAGPGVRHDEFQAGGNETKAIAYASGTYSYQISDTAKFSEGVSVLANDDTTLNSETALSVAINEKFSLKLAYNVTYNTKPPSSAPDKTDTVTSINLVYGL